MLSNRKLFGAALLVAVAALTLGSVQSTAALWRANVVVSSPGTVNTGKLTLTAGSGSASQSATFQFDELKPPNAGLVQTGDFVQRPLIIANGGTIPLKFRLGNVAVSSLSDGIATVHLDVRRVTSATDCPTTGVMPGGAALANSDVQTKGSVTGAVAWEALARSAVATLCVRSTLLAAPATAVTYRHVFTFEAQQLKNNP